MVVCRPRTAPLIPAMPISRPTWSRPTLVAGPAHRAPQLAHPVHRPVASVHGRSGRSTWCASAHMASVHRVGLGRVVGARRDRHAVLGQHAADRLDAEPVPVLVDVVHDHLSRRSSSAVSEKRARGLEDLVRPAQLGDLPLAASRISADSVTAPTGPPAIDGSLPSLDPVPHRGRVDVQQLADMPPRRQLGPTDLPEPVPVHPHRPIRVSWSYFLGADMLPVSLAGSAPSERSRAVQGASRFWSAILGADLAVRVLGGRGE